MLVRTDVCIVVCWDAAGNTAAHVGAQLLLESLVVENLVLVGTRERGASVRNHHRVSVGALRAWLRAKPGDPQQHFLSYGL